MSDAWDPAAARRKLRAHAGRAGLRRSAGSGRLRRRRQHHQERSAVPRSACTRCRRSARCRRESCEPLVEQARQYSFEFLEWKKAFVLRKHWLVHTKRTCPRCNGTFDEGVSWNERPAHFLLRALPEALSRIEDCSAQTSARGRQPAPAISRLMSSSLRSVTRVLPMSDNVTWISRAISART